MDKTIRVIFIDDNTIEVIFNGSMTEKEKRNIIKEFSKVHTKRKINFINENVTISLLTNA
jgi:hypothetical protein